MLFSNTLWRQVECDNEWWCLVFLTKDSNLKFSDWKELRQLVKKIRLCQMVNSQ